MKRLIRLILIGGMLISFSPVTSNQAHELFSSPAEFVSGQSTGMPGRPVLDKPIQGSEFTESETQVIEPDVIEGGGGALELTYVHEYQVVWSDMGSGANLNGAYWRPVVPDGYYALGHYGQSNYGEPWGGMFAVRELDAGALAKPVDYALIWDTGGSGSDYQGAFWNPIPPAGYKCLGMVAQLGFTKPSLDEIRCVRDDLVTSGGVTNLIWWDKGSGANSNFSSWSIGAKEGGINVGAFFGWPLYGPPTDDWVYVLKEDAVWKATPTPELELKYIEEYELEWSDKGSGATLDGAFWRPVVPEGYYSLGHYAQWNYDQPVGPLFAVRELAGSGALAPPVDYNMIWMDTNSGADWNGSFWKPIPPPGYVCLGILAQYDYIKPGLDEMRCVREELAKLARAGGRIWNDRGSGALLDFTAFSLIPAQDNEIYLGTFTGYPTIDVAYADLLFGLDRRAVSFEVDQLSSSEIDGLIQQFGPKLYFQQEEKFWMDDPVWVLNHDMALCWALIADEDDFDSFDPQFRACMGTSSQSLMDDVDYVNNEIKPNEPYNNSPIFRIWLNHHHLFPPGNMTRAKAYVHVIPWNTFFTEIEFWFFYPFNGPGRVQFCTPLCENVQLITNGRHYGDWEHITLRFLNSTKELVAVYMSAHDMGDWFGTGAFGNGLAFYGNHPIVYAAKYSHAHYPTIGTHFYKKIFDIEVYTASLYDLTDKGGGRFDTYLPGNYTVISSPLFPVQEPDWLQYPGRWGGYEKLQTFFLPVNIPGVTPYNEVGSGPYGPNQKTMWNRGDLADIICWPTYPYNVEWHFINLPVISK
jgi:hypothetical protein